MTGDEPVRIAMWSGPRSISTALMRAWDARADTIVVDEPFYAFYLEATGARHPGREEILEAQHTDWREVVAALTAPLPADASIHYQKHMAHHLLPEVDRGWMRSVRHAFLIRDPREVLLSFTRVVDQPRLRDTGLPQQVELLRWLRQRVDPQPPIMDARDVLSDPEGMLRRLCGALDVDFDPAMLSWEPGPRETDGVWARYWYAGVEQSTGFGPYRPRDGEVPEELRPLHDACVPLYRELHRLRIRP